MKIIRILFVWLTLLASAQPANSSAEDGRVALLYDAEVMDAVIKIIEPVCEAAKIKPAHIYIIIDDSINAFVTQGNDLFINTGLLTAFNDPNVLRGVVAHELGHLASSHPTIRRHKVEEMVNRSWLTTLLGLSTLATGNPELGMAVLMGGHHTAQSLYLKYSREQEEIADELAAKYLKESGYTIDGLIKLMDHFNRQEMFIEKKHMQYMVTHPMSGERLKAGKSHASNEKAAAKTRPANTEENARYAMVVAKLRAFLETDKYIKQPQNDLIGPAKSYGDAIASYNKAQFIKAFTTLNGLIAQMPNNGYLYELKGQFLFESGKPLEALEAYKKAMALLGPDTSVKTQYALTLIDASESYKDSNKATEALNEAVAILSKAANSTDKQNPYIFRKLAIAYGKLGKLGYSNLMLAEEALLLDRKKDAERFLKIARQHVGNNVKLKLSIDDLSATLTEGGG